MVRAGVYQWEVKNLSTYVHYKKPQSGLYKLYMGDK
jgi:hypothetical protein